MAEVFTSEQRGLLAQSLDSRLVSTRKGGSGRTLSYLEGHDAIDQANRIFGYGNWAYRPLSVEQVTILDPTTGEAVGVEYKALAELTVRGVVAPTCEVGSQPVAAWNVEEQVMSRRESSARYSHGKPDYDAPITWTERKNARAVIMESHEMAKKGAVTDALKRCLRSFGNQFGNGLYGDGPVDLSEAQGASQSEQRQSAPPDPAGPVTEEQRKSIAKLCQSLNGKKVALPTNFQAARELIAQLSQEYRESRKAAS